WLPAETSPMDCPEPAVSASSVSDVTLARSSVIVEPKALANASVCSSTRSAGGEPSRATSKCSYIALSLLRGRGRLRLRLFQLLELPAKLVGDAFVILRGFFPGWPLPVVGRLAGWCLV